MFTRDGLQRLLHPRSIAIVGATERPGYAARLFQNLLLGGFPGEVLPVSLTRDEVFGRAAVRSLEDLDAPPDVVMVAVPAAQVPEVVRSAGRLGAGAAVVISAGFSEAGAQGRVRTAQLREAAQETGLPVIGPNGNGYATLAADAWATTYSDLNREITRPVLPAVLLSQSGGSAFGAGLGQALDHGFAFEAIFSMGNEEVVTSEQLATHLLRAETRVVAIVAEEFRDPPQLLRAARVARELGRWVVVLKIGRSDAGRRAAATHTAALAGDDVVIDAVLRQHGIIRVDDVDELAQTVGYLARATAPTGDRALVLSHSGGLASLAADLLGAAGFELPDLSDRARARLDELLGDVGGRSNPLDITMKLRDPVVTEVVEVLLAEQPDLLQVITAGDGALPARLRTAVDAAGATAAPVHLVWTSGVRTAIDPSAIELSPVPWFSGARMAATVLQRLRRGGREVEPELPPERTAGAGDGLLVDEVAAKTQVREIGLQVAHGRVAGTVAQLLDLAPQLMAPWVLKVAAPGILHKAADGLLVLGIDDPGTLEVAARRLEERARSWPDARLLLEQQEQVLGELYLGCTLDPHFGPVIGLGPGGASVERDARIAWATCPLDEAGAARLVAEPAVREVLACRPDQDTVSSLIEAVVALSRWFAAPTVDVLELEINPLAIVAGRAALVALDAVLRLSGEAGSTGQTSRSPEQERGRP